MTIEIKYLDLTIIRFLKVVNYGIIQGKRSISDHVEEAINYIKHLKSNVKELEEKKDQLKQSVESTSSTSEFGGSSNSAGVVGSVVIRQSMVGLQIDISVGHEDEGFSLSSGLQVVIDEGLEVVSCTSTKFNDRLIHNLQCQVHAQFYICSVCFEINLLS